ncbi:MAG TPA: heme A synthase, partial [Bacillales bacterium]
MDKAFKGFAVLTTLGMLIVVIMGAIVTNTGSANGCGASWPLCYGQVIPDEADTKTWIELSHRVVSALLGVMVTALAVWSWLRLREVRETKVLAILAVFFIVLQGLLGGAAVIWQQSSFALALHFGFSIISFTSVLLLTIVIFEQLSFGKPYVPKLSKSFKTHIYSLTIYTYIVVYSGAFVRHSGSSLGCGNSWPLCNGQWIPPLATPGGVQFIHRIAAAVVFLWI